MKEHRKNLSIYIEPEQFDNLQQIAKDFGYCRGAKGNVSGLIRAIGDNYLIVTRPQSEIEIIKATEPIALARRHANIAHVALEAKCPELAESHIQLAQVYTSIALLS